MRMVIFCVVYTHKKIVRNESDFDSKLINNTLV